jgi:transposase-like protein
MSSSRPRDPAAARRFFVRALRTLQMPPSEVVTNAAPVCHAVLDELLHSAWRHVERVRNNPIEPWASDYCSRTAAAYSSCPSTGPMTG